MKTLLAVAIFTSLAVHSKALKCYSCIASNEEDCYKQGSQACPQYSDACSTIIASYSIIKSCSYKSFCDQAHHGTPGSVSLDCCFFDDCNGPQKGHSAGLKNSGDLLMFRCLLMVAAAFGWWLLLSML